MPKLFQYLLVQFKYYRLQLRLRTLVHTNKVLYQAEYICCGLNLVLVQNFSNWFNFYFLLFCIHYHNVEQWQIKLKPVQKTLNQGQI